jgi:hypothetical protein
MNGLIIWGVAALAYLAFRLWYDGLRRPLTAQEIDDFLKEASQTSTGSVNDLTALRRFLEEDDGREFAMINLVKLNPEPVPHPQTGEPTPARELVQGYLSDFMPTLLRRGGVPLFQGRKIGPYIDAWGSEPDPGWTLVGSMRYRSRRDLMRLATDPRFLGGHGLKIAALPSTFSFPTRPVPIAFVGPRIWVALTLALGAALTQLALG